MKFVSHIIPYPVMILSICSVIGQILRAMQVVGAGAGTDSSKMSKSRPLRRSLIVALLNNMLWILLNLSPISPFVL